MSQLLVQTHILSACALKIVPHLPLFRLIPKKLQRTHIHGFKYHPPPTPPTPERRGNKGMHNFQLIEQGWSSRICCLSAGSWKVSPKQILCSRSRLSVLAASLLIYMTYTFNRGAVAPGVPWNKVLPSPLCIHVCSPSRWRFSCWGFISSPKCNISLQMFKNVCFCKTLEC